MSDLSKYDLFVQGFQDGSLNVKSTSGLRDERKQSGINKKKKIRYVNLEPGKSSLLLAIKQFSAPYNPMTLMEDDRFNEDSRFRTSLSLTSTVRSLIASALKNGDLKAKYLKKFEKDNKELISANPNTANLIPKVVDDLTPNMLEDSFNRALINAFNKETELLVFSYDSVSVAINAVTNKDYAVKYAIDTDLNEYFSLTPEEREEKKTDVLRVIDLLNKLTYLRINQLEEDSIYKSKTPDEQKKERYNIYKNQPVKISKNPQNFLMCLQLPLEFDEEGDYKLDLDLESLTEDKILDYIVFYPICMAKQMNKDVVYTAIDSYSSNFKPKDVYADFYELSFTVNAPKSEGEAPSRLATPTTIIEKQYPQLKELITRALDKLTSEGKKDIEEVVSTWIPVRRFSKVMEKKTYEALQSNIPLSTWNQLVDEEVLESDGKALSLVLGDQFDLLMESIMDGNNSTRKLNMAESDNSIKELQEIDSNFDEDVLSGKELTSLDDLDQ